MLEENKTFELKDSELEKVAGGAKSAGFKPQIITSFFCEKTSSEAPNTNCLNCSSKQCIHDISDANYYTCPYLYSASSLIKISKTTKEISMVLDPDYYRGGPGLDVMKD